MLRCAGKWLAVPLVALFLGGCGEQTRLRHVLPPEEVSIITPDSAQIAGTWQAVERANAVVICVPTVGFTRDSWKETTSLLNRSGWSVLRLDLRGEGESSLPPGSNWRWSARDTAAAIGYYMKDIQAAVSFIQQKMGRQVKIVLVGADIGGVAALYAAAVNQQITGVALVAPPGGLSNLVARGLVARYGDRPLLIMTELPEATEGPRTTDSWLGRGSGMMLRLTEPLSTRRLENRRAALTMLTNWITSATL